MVIRVVRNLFWASSSQFIQPINQLGVSATLIDETGRGLRPDPVMKFALNPALAAHPHCD
jgi:hypothetical protein